MARDARTVEVERLETRTLLAVINWDGGGGDNLWTNPLNWKGDVLPGPIDTAAINLPGSNPTIQFTGGVQQVAAIKCQEALVISGGILRTVNKDVASWMNGALTISGGTLEVRDWKQNGAFTLSSGSLGGLGKFAIGGAAQWSGGEMAGGGNTQMLAASPGMIISGDVSLTRKLVLDSVLSWVAGTLTLGPNAAFHVLAGRTLNLGAGSAISGATGGLFLSGSLVSAGGRIAAQLWAGGPGASISVDSGELSVGGGSVACPVGVASGAAIVRKESTAKENLCLQPGAALSGAGAWRVEHGVLEPRAPGLVFGSLGVGAEDLGCILRLRVSVTVGQVSLVEGLFEVSDKADVLVTGGFDMSGGQITSLSGVGRITIAPGAEMTVTGASELGRLAAEIRNEGTVVLDMSVSRWVLADIDNAGIVTKTGPARATIIGFKGAGPVNIEEGTLQVDTPLFHEAFEGTITISADAIFKPDGYFWHAPGALITGPGTILRHYDGAGGSVSLGSIDGPALVSVTSPVSVHGPVFRPSALTQLFPAILTLGDATEGSVAGDSYLDGQRIFWELGGTAAGQFATLHTNGKLTITTHEFLIIRWVNGFVPQKGDTFDIMTFGTRVGTFDSVSSGFGFGSKLKLDVLYLADRVRLVVNEK